MKRKAFRRMLNLALGLLASAHLARAQTTAFTYQGKLTDSGNPANGNYDLRFRVYDAATGGTQQGAEYSSPGVSVSKGLFTTTVDFGSTPFTGPRRWLEVDARKSGAADYVTLAPRTELTPVPYAIYAQTAGSVINGAIGPAQLAASSVGSSNLQPGSVTAAKIGSGQVVKSLNGLTDNVTLTAGQNVALTPSGNNIQISTTGGGGPFALNGTSAYYNGGKIGIGTDSPLQALQVANGQILLTPSTASADPGDGTGPAIRMGYSAGSDYGYINANVTGVGWRNLALQQNGGYVGIGTSTPQSALHVKDHGTYSYLTIEKTGPGGEAGIILSTAGQPKWVAYSDNAHTENFQIQSVLENDDFPRLRLPYENKNILLGLSGGNVGVGTANPGCSLEVNGGIRARGGAPGGYGSANNGYAFSGNGGDNDSGMFSSRDGQIEFYSNAGEVMRVVGRSVGIGTTDTAGHALHVVGDNYGVSGEGNNIGVYAHNPSSGKTAYLATPGLAGDFYGDVYVHGSATVGCLTINGGCDLAEPFKMSTKDLAKGSLVVIDQKNPGQLKLSERAYDKRLAGIISGANGIKAGISLHQEGVMEGGQNVALTGRVYALADASNSAIEPGDFLTSSDTPGHCMKATNPLAAQGAIIGKAMSGLDTGKGLVLVLVSLQ